MTYNAPALSYTTKGCARLQRHSSINQKAAENAEQKLNSVINKLYSEELGARLSSTWG